MRLRARGCGIHAAGCVGWLNASAPAVGKLVKQLEMGFGAACCAAPARDAAAPALGGIGANGAVRRTRSMDAESAVGQWWDAGAITMLERLGHTAAEAGEALTACGGHVDGAAARLHRLSAECKAQLAAPETPARVQRSSIEVLCSVQSRAGRIGAPYAVLAETTADDSASDPASESAARPPFPTSESTFRELHRLSEKVAGDALASACGARAVLPGQGCRRCRHSGENGLSEARRRLSEDAGGAEPLVFQRWRRQGVAVRKCRHCDSSWDHRHDSQGGLLGTTGPYADHSQLCQ